MPERLRAVLVTGASRGLGRAIALHAASSGFRVWAGVRDQAAASEVVSIAANSGVDLRPVILDVTDKIQHRGLAPRLPVRAERYTAWSTTQVSPDAASLRIIPKNTCAKYSR